MAKPVVIVVGADKGGVGKTTVSRTLLDYFSANNVPTRAFDTESPRGTLKRFHPDITEIVDMTTTSDQMKIFDTLNAASPHICFGREHGRNKGEFNSLSPRPGYSCGIR